MKAQFKEIQDLISSDDIDISKLGDIAQNCSNEQLREQAQEVRANLKSNMLLEMQSNPAKFSRERTLQAVNSGMFSLEELFERELMTRKSWERLQIPKEQLPDMKPFQYEDPNLSVEKDCTDIYFFGIPGSGKTCLLMTLIGADGKENFSYDPNGKPGKYASALKKYYLKGRTPGRTYGSYTTVINASIMEARGNKQIKHNINLVEMAGETFARDIVDNEEAKVTFESMGVGVTNILTNQNRKVFFLIVDSSAETVDFSYLEETKDDNGVVIDQNKVTKPIFQEDMLKTFIGLFQKNPKVMERVDAIHIIVTKADTLDSDEKQQLPKAKELLMESYSGPIQDLKKYCFESGRINKSTNYLPHVFAFSMGKFYLGDVYEDDLEDTLEIIRTIGAVTIGTKAQTWWDKLRETIA